MTVPKILSFLVFAVFAAVLVAFAAVPARGAPKVEAPKEDDLVWAGDYGVSGPYVHDILTVFLLHAAGGGDDDQGVQYLTLEQAMRDKQAVVYETGKVEVVEFENRSDRPL